MTENNKVTVFWNATPRSLAVCNDTLEDSSTLMMEATGSPQRLTQTTRSHGINIPGDGNIYSTDS
jgi:hypothetical protein